MRRVAPPEPPLQDCDLLLRPGMAADAADIRDVYSEADIRHWMGWDTERPDDAQARANLEREAEAWRKGTWAVFRVVDVAAGRVVGGINLRFGEHDIAEVSYFLRSSARGRGFATRAVRLVARWAFSELGVQRLELRAHPENAASRRVAERAGFTHEGLERASRAWPDGRRFDSVVYSLLPSDVPSLDSPP